MPEDHRCRLKHLSCLLHRPPHHIRTPYPQPHLQIYEMLPPSLFSSEKTSVVNPLLCKKYTANRFTTFWQGGVGCPSLVVKPPKELPCRVRVPPRSVWTRTRILPRLSRLGTGMKSLVFRLFSLVSTQKPRIGRSGEFLGDLWKFRWRKMRNILSCLFLESGCHGLFGLDIDPCTFLVEARRKAMDKYDTRQFDIGVDQSLSIFSWKKSLNLDLHLPIGCSSLLGHTRRGLYSPKGGVSALQVTLNAPAKNPF